MACDILAYDVHTDYISPTGVCSASSEEDGEYYAWKAFDSDSSLGAGGWSSRTDEPYPQTLIYEFTNALTICGGNIVPSAAGATVKSFNILSSTDGSTWTTEDSFINVDATSEIEFIVDSSTPIKYLSLEVTEGDRDNYVMISQFVIYETVVSKPVFGSSDINNFMVGSTQIDKVMVGSELLWSTPPAELGCDPFGDGSGILYDKLDNALVNECGGDITGVWGGTESYCPDGIHDACACDFQSNISYDITTPMPTWTISIWFKIADTATATSIQHIIGLDDNTDSRWRFDGVDVMTISLQGMGLEVLDPIDIVKDKWYNLVIGYEDTSYTHYLDGVQQFVTTFINALDVITLGGYGNTNQLLEGSIDEVRLFDRVLTPEEVEILYNDGINNLRSK